MTGAVLSGWLQPIWLLAIPLALAGLVLLWRRQKQALIWLEANTSRRGRIQWTRHTEGSLLRHFVLLAAAAVLLAIAAAGPYSIGTVTAQLEDRSIVLLIDASLSMAAKDVPIQAVAKIQQDSGIDASDAANEADGDDEHISRLDAAKETALALLHAEPKARFALVTFSGAAVIHSPPTYDHLGLESLLRTLRLHIDVPTSGTRFSTAFEAAARLVASRDEPVDVVLLSDGELPEEDAVDDGLRLLELRGTPVHAIGFGGSEATTLRAFRLDDLLWNKDENRVATTFLTSREDAELQRITERTQAVFAVPQEGDSVGPLLAGLESGERTRGPEMEGERGLSWLPLMLFATLFLHETLWLAHLSKPRWIDGLREGSVEAEGVSWALGPATSVSGSLSADASNPRLGIQRSTRRGGKAALAIAPLLFLAECPEPVGTAARVIGATSLNEVGREYSENEDWVPAQLAFRHAASLGWRQEVSRTNLATVQLNAEPESKPPWEDSELTPELHVGPRVAHETFERVLDVHPRYRPAQHGDGLALYRWGEQELDIEACETERTRVLWDQAATRFKGAGRLAFWFTKARQVAILARANHAALLDRLAELDAIDQQCNAPPPQGPPPPEDSDSESDSSNGGGSTGGGGGSDGDQDQNSGSNGGGEGGGDDRSEGQGGGSGNGGAGAGGEGDGEGNSEEQSPDSENSGSGLSENEKQEVAAALERVRAESQQARGYHQLARSQLNPDNAKAAQGLVRKW